MKHRDVEKALRAQKCTPKMGKGDHEKWTCPCGQHSTVVSKPGSVSPGLVPPGHPAHDLPAEGMAPVSTTYRVTAKPWEHGWELHVDGVGVTQVAHLARAEQQVRDYVETDLEIDASDADVEITYELDPDLLGEVHEARMAVLRAARAQVEAAAKSREAVRRLKAQGISQSDIAHVVGVSKGRVSQLANS